MSTLRLVFVCCLGLSLALAQGQGVAEAETLNVWISGGAPGDVAPFGRGRENAVARFERENGVRVEIHWTEWHDVVGRYIDAAVQGTAPDVFLVSAESIPLLSRLGLIASVEDAAQTWDGWSEFYPSAKESVTRKGEAYGVPAAALVESFVYSEAPFIRYGVDFRELPRTWEAYRDLVSRLTVVNDSHVEARGTATGWLSKWKTWLSWLWQAGGELIDADGAPLFAGGRGVEALDYLADLRTIVAPGEAGDVGEGLFGITTGRMASVLADPSALRAAKAYRPMQSDFLIVGPMIGKERTEAVVEYDAWVVSSGSADPGLAWRFVVAMAESETAARFAAALGRLPARSDAVGRLSLIEGGRDLMPFVETLEKHGRALPAVDGFGALAGIMQGAVHRAVHGEAGAAEALDGAAAMWNDLRP